MKKTLVTILIIAVIGAAGYFGYTRYRKAQAAKAATYSTDVVSRGDLTAIIGATGTVRANQTATIAWQTSGQIASIPVVIDELVKTDQVLASLAPTSLSQSLILARADLITAQRNLDSLLNSNTTAAQAYLTLVQAQKTLEDAQKDQSNKKYYSSSQNSIDAARADLTIAQNELNRAQDIYDQFANRSDDDLMKANALSSLAAARQKRDRAQANLNALLATPDVILVDEAGAKVDLAKAQLADAQREWERLKDGPDANDITIAQAKIDSIQASLQLTSLKAPFNGTITEVNSLVGDLVSPGTASFRIDDLSHLLVDVQVTEVDINKVKLDQPVKLTFDAILNKEYNGKVVEVSRVGSVSAGSVNFTVTVELLDADDSIRPGMTAAANIIVEQIQNALLVPNRAVRLRDGQRVVYVLQNNTPTPVNITIGANSDQYSEILEGDIKEGDTLVLNPPTEFGTNGRPPF